MDKDDALEINWAKVAGELKLKPKQVQDVVGCWMKATLCLSSRATAKSKPAT